MRSYLLKILLIGGIAGILSIPAEFCNRLFRRGRHQPMDIHGASPYPG